MRTATFGAVGVGVGGTIAGLAISFVPGEARSIGLIMLALGMLGVLVFLRWRAHRIVSAVDDPVSVREAGNLSKVRLGVGVIVLIPIIEGVGLPSLLGLQGASFAPPLSVLDVLLLLVGVQFLARGAYQVRERRGYCETWVLGLTLAILAPVIGVVSGLLPSTTAAGSYLSQSIGGIAGLVMFLALGMASYLEGQYAELDAALGEADALFRSRRYPDAIRAYDHSIEVGHNLFSHLLYDPETGAANVRPPDRYVVPWVRKGDCHTLMGKHRKALAIYDVILSLDPANGEILNRKGEVYLRLQLLTDALGCFERALSVQPGLQAALVNRQRTLDSLRKAGVAPPGAPQSGPAAPQRPAPTPTWH